eukprot:Blabericola_migrator_1__4238@NODE_22_length_22262_cov_139_742014_g19_i0_p7_GENE_NODE_22_length_22262_cov_139_742014_g19_i0NODE_22_length_22262_cov_139_742014_g19_i0_p7_ORF_typecomplete_len429_score49_02AP2/PF00847_20/7_6e09_NODE_22_length_22262_cov_139_742014_g19_i01211113397
MMHPPRLFKTSAAAPKSWDRVLPSIRSCCYLLRNFGGHGNRSLMLLDSDTFFPSTPPPSTDDALDVLGGWEWATSFEDYGTTAAHSSLISSVAPSLTHNTPVPGNISARPNSPYERHPPGTPNSARPQQPILGSPATRSNPAHVEEFFYDYPKYDISAESSYFSTASTAATSPTGQQGGVATGLPPQAIVTSCDIAVGTPAIAVLNTADCPGGGGGESSVAVGPSTARRGRPKRTDTASPKVGILKKSSPIDLDETSPTDVLANRRRLPGDVTCYRGVYFDSMRHLWRANWPEESVIIDQGTRNVIDVRRCTRTKGFSAKKFGFQEAQRMAIEHREKMTGPGMVRHYVYQQDSSSATIPGSKGSRSKNNRKPNGETTTQDVSSLPPDPSQPPPQALSLPPVEESIKEEAPDVSQMFMSHTDVSEMLLT